MPEYIYYKIVSIDENIKDCYVGKTTNFKRRVKEHKSDCYNKKKKSYNIKLYQYIRENGGINNFNFIEIETNEYNDKDSAIIERYWIEELNANLNSEIPTRTLQEWYENNKEYLKEKHKEYFEKNKEIINKKHKEYNKKNIEKIKEYQNEYRNKNRKNLNEYFKEYRENNKEKINEKIICKCGCEIIKRNLSKHLKSKKHIDLMS
jgi:hypothetical protein